MARIAIPAFLRRLVTAPRRRRADRDRGRPVLDLIEDELRA